MNLRFCVLCLYNENILTDASLLNNPVLYEWYKIVFSKTE